MWFISSGMTVISLVISIGLFLLPLTIATNSSLPVVLWHGMGDSCCNPLSMGMIKKFIEMNTEPQIYVKSLRIGNNVAEDIENGFTMNVNLQVQDACKQIANDENLSLGYNAIGFSQGGQFLRAVAERCPNPPINTLISIGGQQQGVFGMPYCTHTNKTFCEFMRKLITHGAYISWIQNLFVQAQYWHDPLNEGKYIQNSIFLADINNERGMNYVYRKNFMSVSMLVLVMFERDSMVIPKESAWFGYYAPGQDKIVSKMEETVLYQADRIGLKFLNENHRIHFLSVNGDHLRFTKQWFINNIVKKYL